MADPEKHQGNPTKSWIAQSIELSSERNFFELSPHTLPGHEESIARYGSRTHENPVAARTQIDHFLAINTELSSDGQPMIDVITELTQSLETESELIYRIEVDLPGSTCVY
jgi:hypothetical protein